MIPPLHILTNTIYYPIIEIQVLIKIIKENPKIPLFKFFKYDRYIIGYRVLYKQNSGS